MFKVFIFNSLKITYFFDKNDYISLNKKFNERSDIILLFFFSKSLMSSLIDELWILVSASVLNLLWYHVASGKLHLMFM